MSSLKLSLSKIESSSVEVTEFYLLHYLFQMVTSHILPNTMHSHITLDVIFTLTFSRQNSNRPAARA